MFRLHTYPSVTVLGLKKVSYTETHLESDIQYCEAPETVMRGLYDFLGPRVNTYLISTSSAQLEKLRNAAGDGLKVWTSLGAELGCMLFKDYQPLLDKPLDEGRFYQRPPSCILTGSHTANKDDGGCDGWQRLLDVHATAVVGCVLNVANGDSCSLLGTLCVAGMILTTRCAALLELGCIHSHTRATIILLARETISSCRLQW
ncbi:hypothetical protein CERSUDRAFT_73092 [Gelatoporia subvermispora B]|uniref:Uncharacterized protein n=1 Tax=Ceriporiopsis subvermispora (strain B) TaxID=914234 RepID=M2R282_CERS8|nr:hypothetical protein CERSUDRAFT_73092 [Gelatoporia subvermispora B]